MLLCHLLTQIFEHCIELLIGCTTVCRSYALALLLVIIAVLGNTHNGWAVDKLLTRIGYGDKTVILDIFIYQTHNKTLTDNGTPETIALLCTDAEILTIIMSVALDNGSSLTK